MKRVVSIVLVLLLLIGTKIQAQAEVDPYSQAVKIRCTCYYYNSGNTASGKPLREGYRTLAGKKEWIGSVAALYRLNPDGSKGNFIGYYEVTDTGGESIRKGRSIDVYRQDLDECKDWIEVFGDYVYMELYKGVG